MTNDSVGRHLRLCLARSQLPSGGWSALSSSSQASVESSSLAYLALPSDFGSARDGAREFLLGIQNPNGSWPAFVGDDNEGSWTTALVVIALRDDIEATPERRRGLEWLLDSAGEESNWFWKWKFRTADRRVRFDPDKFGWPWVPHTNSWVVPTAFSILALDETAGDRGFQDRKRRVELGTEMLLDRGCPGGGWNSGNGIVYGAAMAPHPDDTAIALLALGRRAQGHILSASVDYLERAAPMLNAGWSLAWCVLALSAYHRQVDPLIRQFSCWSALDQIEDTSTLAVSCLAVDPAQAFARIWLGV